jgi:hypothetical protein
MALARLIAVTALALACAFALLGDDGDEPRAYAAGGKKIAKPKIEFDPIPYGKSRKHQMAGYSERHYGDRSWRLDNPKAIVLHYTASSTYESAWNTFASNDPALGERPGVCSQFIVDKDGTIYQLTRLAVRCRHTIGLNHVSFGIEMVQEDAGGSHETAQTILERDKQARAAVRLAAWLKQRYGIAMRDLIGHAMANDSRLFEDKQGWRNDHTDWQRAEVRTFRKRVNRLLKGGRDRPPSPRAGGADGRYEGKRSVFGESVEGRKLVARRIGNAASRRTALIVGEIHGDEEAGRPIVKDFRREHRRYEHAAVWTVASVNPDGHDADQRKNAHGVDLNRNFPVGWSSAEPPSSGYYGGPEPFSEPESKAVARLVKRIDPDITVWYHQPWGAVLAPCSGDADAERRYARISGLPMDRCRGENLPGTATRWQERRGATAFVVELGAQSPEADERRRHVRALAAVLKKD